MAVKPEDVFCQSRTSPPPAASKKVVPVMRSSNSSVKAPARKGVAITAMMLVASTAQHSSGIRQIVISGGRMLRMVTMKLIEPRIDDSPSKCAPSAQSV